MTLPQIVSRGQWLAAREELRAREEALVQARDEVSAERRRLPMVEIDTEYVFEGGDGKASLLDLFAGRQQLVVHHFMFAPDWETGCRGCAAFLDQIGCLAHLQSRNTSFVAISRAPYTKILPFKARMGWTLPWYSSHDNDFNHDFGATGVGPAGELRERPGISCFLREQDRVFHTYSVHEKGLDGIGSTASLLDLTALGRQEAWEEPRGRAQALGLPVDAPVLFHDEYDY